MFVCVVRVCLHVLGGVDAVWREGRDGAVWRGRVERRELTPSSVRALWRGLLQRT